MSRPADLQLQFSSYDSHLSPGVMQDNVNTKGQFDFSSALSHQRRAHEKHADKLLTDNRFSNTPRWQKGERLHHLFEQRCDLLLESGQTEHLAVDVPGGALSFVQLDQRANQLARYLRVSGYGSGDVIGLLFDKSAHSYISMLAVLKINAAYVPLDSAFPQERMAYIAGDSGMKTLLTLSCYQQLVQTANLPFVCVDAIEPELQQLTDTRLSIFETGAPDSQLCYIIYTSGSTGLPKGVSIEQASICNFVRVAGEVYGYEADDRVYQGLTIAFDFAVEEIWVPLSVGATLVPNQTGSSLLGEDLAEFLLDNEVTAMCCVPTLLATIDRELPDLRLLIVSGEACPQDLINRWYSDSCSVLNAYGPTETTVTATLARSKPNQAVTIGKPLPSYTVLILEPGTENVLPFGSEGEIAIAGIGVATGYLNREEQTRKAFIPDFLPIPDNPSGLIYRSGDLGLINEAGDIEYRGRIDSQVKVRGYRIELTEIESVILQIPQVAQAAVDTYEPLPGVKELVAYYTLKDPILQDDLVEVLRAQLPAYMVPAFYERLDLMPMLASDKVDRKALPKPLNVRMAAANQDNYISPQTDLESEIAIALGELLQLKDISVNSHFFNDLGASSLLMARFSARLRKIPAINEISMRDLYAHPNIAELSAHLESTPKSVGTKEQVEPFRIPSNMEYYTCGFLQISTYMGLFFVGLFLALQIIPWVLAANGFVELYGRIVIMLAGSFFGWTALSLATKWALVGEWKAEKFPIWGMRYYRFWLVKLVVTFSPPVLFRGYPLYNVYLRLLGANIGRNVVINSANAPVYTDLLSIGDNTILRADSLLISYKARSNYIYSGLVTLGENVIIGDGSTIDLNTSMGDNSQLGHASSLQEHQSVPAGKHYHGVPARETTTDFSSGDACTVSVLRQSGFTMGQLVSVFFGLIPLTACLVYWLVVSFALPRYELLTFSWALDVLAVTLVGALGVFIAGACFVLLLPRLLYRFLKPGRVYTLYGFHFFIFKWIQTLSNVDVYNQMFGDSSLIVYYLKLLGYRLSKIVQTGSNFGLEQEHDVPYLCHYGSRTMISDGVKLINLHQSSTAFRLEKALIGDDSFIGNNVFFPADAKTGKNCLVATKTMVPVDGDRHCDVGLLGSPAFEIPRISEPDASDVFADTPANRAGLRNKNRVNLLSLGVLVLSGVVYFYVTLLALYAAAQSYATLGTLGWVFAASGFMVFSISYFIFLERAILGFRRMEPIEVSIYAPEYWRVERLWKFSETFLRWLWVGTPMRYLINRALGVSQGKKVFDDGLYISEKTLAIIGDHCNFNANSVLQSHSLEQGLYKSDYIRIADQCTLESNSFIHYGTKVENKVLVGLDAFVMKGETLAEKTIWRGNPASTVSVG